MKVWEPRKPLTSVRSTWYDTLAMLAAVLLLLPGAAGADAVAVAVASIVVVVVAAVVTALLDAGALELGSGGGQLWQRRQPSLAPPPYRACRRPKAAKGWQSRSPSGA